MINKQEINNNINTEFSISYECLKEHRYGLCRYISDICNSIDDLNNDIASIAMVYVNYFFLKRCYFEHEKLVIACASILLACKYQNIQGKFDQICRRYLEQNMKLLGQCSTEIQKIKDKICMAEVTLLKCLNFNINISIPHEFIYVYAAILYPDNEEDIVQFSIKISNDSFFTYSNLLFKNYVIAISSVIIAAKFINLPTILDNNFQYITNMKRFSEPTGTEEEFNRRLLNYENKSFHLRNELMQENTNDKNSYFDILETCKKIHPYLELEDLNDCIKFILEYYEDSVSDLK